MILTTLIALLFNKIQFLDVEFCSYFVDQLLCVEMNVIIYFCSQNWVGLCSFISSFTLTAVSVDHNSMFSGFFL